MDNTIVSVQLNFSVERDVLLSTLQSVAGVVERRQTLPILGNVLFQVSEQELKVTGTDLEVELTASCPIINELEAGGITVPARKLIDICRLLPEGTTIVLNLDKQNLIVKSGSSRFTLACLPAAEFPHAPALEEPTAFAISSEQLYQLFCNAHFAMAQQDVRYFLNGCLLHLDRNTVTVVATDGHRLALARRPITVDNVVDKKVIIPRKAVLELIRLLQKGAETVNISFDNNHICFNSAGCIMVSKLVDGRFPDYHRVIPRHNDKPLTIDRNIFKQALSRVAVLANEKHHGVRLDIKSGSLTLYANNPEREQAEDVIPVEYYKDNISIGFNVSYLLDILNAQPEGATTWLFSNSSGSVLLENNMNLQENIYVVMPMRL